MVEEVLLASVEDEVVLVDLVEVEDNSIFLISFNGYPISISLPVGVSLVRPIHSVESDKTLDTIHTPPNQLLFSTHLEHGSNDSVGMTLRLYRQN